MHWIDIVLIAVLVIFALIGLKRGLVDSVLSLFSTVVSIGLAIWAAKPFAGFMEQCFKLTSWISKNMAGMFAKWSANFAQVATESITGAQAINASSLSNWQQSILKLMVGECVVESGTTAAHTFANVIAPIAVIVISGILAFILIKFAVFLLSKLFDALLKSRVLNTLDRVLGFVLGAVKGALVICVLMGITVFIPNERIISVIDQTKLTKIAYGPVTDFIKVNIADKLQQWADDIMPDKDTGEETKATTSYIVTIDNNQEEIIIK